MKKNKIAQQKLGSGFSFTEVIPGHLNLGRIDEVLGSSKCILLLHFVCVNQLPTLLS